jgi:DNA processing protein
MIPRRVLTDGERIAWIRLARTESIGPVTFASLVSAFGSIHEALAEAPRLARRGGGELRLAGDDEARREIDRLSLLGGKLIACVEPEFPAPLAALEPPPPLLAVLGRADLLQSDIVAIVGARNASALGMRFTTTLAGDLGREGFVIASGLARGIDRAAHEAALESGTVAVMAGGIDVVYPHEHRDLYEKIAARGAIVSEMPIGVTPQARHFPRRNRIISGLSRGVVVIEAAERSGSLITANYALEQGREVFAVPGSPLDPRARGANRLLRDGATLTEGAEDVLSVLHPSSAREPAAAIWQMPDAPPADVTVCATDDTVRKAVEEKISPAPVEIDELVRQCAAPAPLVLTVLLELELAQRIRRHAGGRVSWA